MLDGDDRAAAKADAGTAAEFDGSGDALEPARRFPRWAQALLTLAGLVLLVVLFLNVGLAAVLDYLARFGPWFLVIVAISFLGLFLQAWAWHIIQAAHFRPVPLLRLFRVKIISDSLNTLVPTANIGGDAARPFLVRDHAPLRESIPGVLADKTVEAFAASLFLAVGFLLSLLLLKLPAWMNTAAAVSLAVTVTGIGLFIGLQMKGSLWTLGRLARILPHARHLAARNGRPLAELDANLRLIYRGLDLKTAAAAVGLHFVARLLGTVEVCLIMKILGAAVTVPQALFTSTGVTLVNTVFFIMPGQFGVTESAHILMLRSLGFSAAIGLSLGVIRRIRKLITTAVGLVLYAGHRSTAEGAIREIIS